MDRSLCYICFVTDFEVILCVFVYDQKYSVDLNIFKSIFPSISSKGFNGSGRRINQLKISKI